MLPCVRSSTSSSETRSSGACTLPCTVPNPDPSRCSAPLSCRRVSAGDPVNVGSDCCHFEASLGVRAKSSSGFVLFFLFLRRTHKKYAPKMLRLPCCSCRSCPCWAFKSLPERKFTHVMLTKICLANHLFMMSQRALICLRLSHTPFFFFVCATRNSHFDRRL